MSRCKDPDVGINLVYSRNRGALWLKPGKEGKGQVRMRIKDFIGYRKSLDFIGMQ